MQKKGLLSKLPPPPESRLGWPWTVQSTLPSNNTINGKEWPRITIITPSFNQGKFLEETIRSILLQNYPNLEYIIMDGGSIDSSPSIIKKYSKWLTYYEIKKDNGQIDAINKGASLATGEIISWVNSDDILLPNCLIMVAIDFINEKKNRLHIYERFNIDENSNYLNAEKISKKKVTYFDVAYCYRWPFYQESVFIPKEIWDNVGGIKNNYRLIFDFEFFSTAVKINSAVTHSNKMAGCWRRHEDQKVSNKNATLLRNERKDIYNKLQRSLVLKGISKVLLKFRWNKLWNKDVIIADNIHNMKFDSIMMRK